VETVLVYAMGWGYNQPMGISLAFSGIVARASKGIGASVRRCRSHGKGVVVAGLVGTKSV